MISMAQRLRCASTSSTFAKSADQTLSDHPSDEQHAAHKGSFAVIKTDRSHGQRPSRPESCWEGLKPSLCHTRRARARALTSSLHVLRNPHAHSQWLRALVPSLPWARMSFSPSFNRRRSRVRRKRRGWPSRKSAIRVACKIGRWF